MSRARPFTPLPSQHLELLEGWAMISRSMAYVYRPSTIEGVRETVHLARETGRSLIGRGAGYSYGDPALNAENIVLDLTRMNRVLAWDPATGVVTVEPGVTIRDLYRYIIEDGWWIPVVPGATRPTIGGCVAMNVHGKNNWHAGPLGEYVLSFDLLLPSGQIVTCTPQQNADLFYAAIGGFGMLGLFVSLTLQMKRTPTGVLQVHEIAVSSLDEMIRQTDRVTDLPDTDYMVGWIDAFASGSRLGRGLIQWASEVREGLDLTRTLRAKNQELNDYMLGAIARSRLWLFAKPGANGLGMRAANTAKFLMGSQTSGRTFQQPHGQFHFFHDYSPNTREAFRPGGFIQYQPFLPTRTAHAASAELLERSQRAGFTPVLCVFKRHRSDQFLMNYNVDGYSLSLDYQVTPANKERLKAFCLSLDRIVLDAGGKFYAAKDDTLDRAAAHESYGAAAIAQFQALKARYDPDGLLQSDMYRRLFVS